MEINQNPSHTISKIPNQISQPIASEIPPVNSAKPATKFSLKAIIGIIIFIIIAGGAAAGYVYRDPIMSLI